MPQPPDRPLPSAPPLLNGAGLLLWGWQCGFMTYAVIMAVVLEMARWVDWRTSLTDQEFNHITDLSSVIFLLVVIYVFYTRSYQGIFYILALLPFIFFLLLLAQQYSVQGTIKPSALFVSLRKLKTTEHAYLAYEIDLTFPYLLLCIISASAGNQQAQLFYVLVSLLTAWTLWALRLKRSGIWQWLLLLLLACASGYMGQAGLIRLQAMAETTFLELFDQFMWRSRDPTRTTTAIGSLGRLKLSDRIMVRMDTHGRKLDKPLLLREVAYSRYGYGVWSNDRDTLQAVDPTADGTQWIIYGPGIASEQITLGFYLDEKHAVVPAPAGLVSISNVGATQIEYSPYGALAMEYNPGWVRYDSHYNSQTINDALPDREDLDVPLSYKDDFDRLVNQLGLAQLTPTEKVTAIERFFAENFYYSLTQTERYPRGKYLSKFLFENRQGHCEYFATATALLLRAAGIPSRYVVGYSVDEYSTLEGQYIARASHAHSWVQAYVDNNWQIIDTTPSIWAADEEQNKSPVSPLVDLWSWLAYHLALWNTDESGKDSTLLVWMLFPVLLYYLWKIFIKDRLQKITTTLKDNRAKANRPGMNSGIYRLIAALEKNYSPRKPGETLTAWLTAIEKHNPIPGLRELLALHYRNRFDPAGLSVDENQTLEEQVNMQLATLH